jgi:uncharacterized protein (TIGR03086 family)
VNELSNAATALNVLRRAVESIDDSQLGLQTPCRDYDVAALAEHLVDSVTRISAAAGVVVPGSGEETMARVLDAGRDAVAGWRRRGTDGGVPFAGRTLPARDLLGVITLEFVVHGWDFATAVGEEVNVPDGLVADLLGLAHRTVTAESRRVAGFDEPVALAGDASALDRLLAFTGRDPATRTLFALTAPMA